MSYLYVLSGITFLLSPTKGLQDYSLILPAFIEKPVTYYLYRLTAALIGLLALGIVPIVSNLVGLKKMLFLFSLT